MRRPRFERERQWIKARPDYVAALNFIRVAVAAADFDSLRSPEREFNFIPRGHMRTRNRSKVSCFSFRMILRNGTGYLADCEIMQSGHEWSEGWIRIQIFGGPDANTVRGYRLTLEDDDSIGCVELERDRIYGIHPSMTDPRRERSRFTRRAPQPVLEPA